MPPEHSANCWIDRSTSFVCRHLPTIPVATHHFVMPARTDCSACPRLRRLSPPVMPTDDASVPAEPYSIDSPHSVLPAQLPRVRLTTSGSADPTLKCYVLTELVTAAKSRNRNLQLVDNAMIEHPEHGVVATNQLSREKAGKGSLLRLSKISFRTRTFPHERSRAARIRDAFTYCP